MGVPCMSVDLPGFPGFYDSELSSALDWQESSWIENEESGRELEHPPELRLEGHELADLIFHHSTHRIGYTLLSRWWADAFAYRAEEATGVDLALTFDEMVSPREYNFTTDRVFGKLPLRAVRQLFALSKAKGHETLAARIKRDCTSRDGFSSFYPNALADWLAKPLRDWDHNEVSILLAAVIVQETGEPLRRFVDQVNDDAIGDDGAYQAWEACVDWLALESAMEDSRREKAEAVGQDMSWRTGPAYRHPDQAPLALGGAA